MGWLELWAFFSWSLNLFPLALIRVLLWVFENHRILLSDKDALAVITTSARARRGGGSSVISSIGVGAKMHLFRFNLCSSIIFGAIAKGSAQITHYSTRLIILTCGIAHRLQEEIKPRLMRGRVLLDGLLNLTFSVSKGGWWRGRARG